MGQGHTQIMNKIIHFALERGSAEALIKKEKWKHIIACCAFEHFFKKWAFFLSLKLTLSLWLERLVLNVICLPLFSSLLPPFLLTHSSSFTWHVKCAAEQQCGCHGSQPRECAHWLHPWEEEEKACRVRGRMCRVPACHCFLSTLCLGCINRQCQRRAPIRRSLELPAVYTAWVVSPRIPLYSPPSVDVINLTLKCGHCPRTVVKWEAWTVAGCALLLFNISPCFLLNCLGFSLGCTQGPLLLPVQTAEMQMTGLRYYN